MKVLATLNMQLGECPRWNEIEQSWYWVDITGKNFYRYKTLEGKLEQRQFDFQPACFAFTENNDIILTSSDGIYRLANFTDELTLIAHPEQRIPSNRFNDGVPTPDGDFIIGSIGNGEEPEGSTYLLSLNNNQVTCELIESGFTIINGQAFSPDGAFYYFTDTPSQIIYRRPYDQQTKTLGEKQVFYRCEADEYPDGAAVDKQGNYWVAMYGSSKVVVISPEGDKLREIALPVSQPTMVAFGGENLEQLVITTAAQWLPEGSDEADAGSVFILDAAEQGCSPSKVRG